MTTQTLTNVTCTSRGRRVLVRMKGSSMTNLRVPVEEFTTPNPLTVPYDAHLDELAEVMGKNGIRHLPVVRDRRVVGVVSQRDLNVAQNLSKLERMTIKAQDIMSTDPVTVGYDMPLDEVAFIMSDKKIGSVIVNDDEDKLLGIFTSTDALNALIEVIRLSQEDGY